MASTASQKTMDNTITLQQFKLWSTNALKVFLRVRNKKTDGDFEELVARYAWSRKHSFLLSCYCIK